MQKKAMMKQIMVELKENEADDSTNEVKLISSVQFGDSIETKSTGIEIEPQNAQLIPMKSPNTPTEIKIQTIIQTVLFQQGSS